MKIVSLNLNHRTRGKAVEEGLIAELCALEPDLMIFNEFVHGPINQDVPAKLATSGFEHLASSKQYSYSPGRYQNQILMASRSPIESVIHYTTGIDDAANSNVLTVVTGGFTITGIRAPAYKTTREWESYWDWLGGMAQGEIVIGDFNVVLICV